MITTIASRGSCPISGASRSRPDWSPRRISTNARSHADCSTTRSASAPDDASATSWPSASSVIRSIRRMFGSSSTIKTRMERHLPVWIITRAHPIPKSVAEWPTAPVKTPVRHRRGQV